MKKFKKETMVPLKIKVFQVQMEKKKDYKNHYIEIYYYYIIIKIMYYTLLLKYKIIIFYHYKILL